jgi:hypothetical protein
MQDLVSEYFDVKGIFQHSLIKRLVFKFNKFPIVYQEGPEEAQSFFEKEVKNWRYYYAYCQSEVYFKSIKEELRKRIKIKQKYKDAFESKYGHLFREKKVLAIHYRFGDYKEWGKEELGGINMTLPQAYYRNAINLVPDLEDYHVILITDDISTCEERTSYLKSKTIISDTEIMDFQLMLNADKLIIANSTFSWWAAYLNTKGAQVLAPEHWLGFKVRYEFPNGIIPPNYVKVGFEYRQHEQQ